MNGASWIGTGRCAIRFEWFRLRMVVDDGDDGRCVCSCVCACVCVWLGWREWEIGRLCRELEVWIGYPVFLAAFFCCSSRTLGVTGGFRGFLPRHCIGFVCDLMMMMAEEPHQKRRRCFRRTRTSRKIRRCSNLRHRHRPHRHRRC